jgi:hypothetical protein
MATTAATLLTSLADLTNKLGTSFPNSGNFSGAAKLIQGYAPAMKLLNATVAEANASGLTLQYSGLGTINYPNAQGELFYSGKSPDFHQPV